MKRIGVVMFVLAGSLLIGGGETAAFLTDLTEAQCTEAIREGSAYGTLSIKHLNSAYSFGDYRAYEENGVVRTKWAKLVVLSGLLAARKRAPTDDEKRRILNSPLLQIDVHTYGDRIDFAKAYTVELLQNGQTIKPKETSVVHMAYKTSPGAPASGYPLYRATLAAHFPCERISPDAEAEVLLIKPGHTTRFKLNFKEYR